MLIYIFCCLESWQDKLGWSVKSHSTVECRMSHSKCSVQLLQILLKSTTIAFHFAVQNKVKGHTSTLQVFHCKRWVTAISTILTSVTISKIWIPEQGSLGTRLRCQWSLMLCCSHFSTGQIWIGAEGLNYKAKVHG